MHVGLCAALNSGCGYHSAFPAAEADGLSVEVGLVLVAEPLATQAAASGARAELAAQGALASTSSRRLVVDVLRLDETSRGIHVNAGRPLGSGMSIAVTARGRVFLGQAQEPAIDTGDLRRAVQIAGDLDPRVDSAAYEQALRTAAERAGRAVARAALGLPEPSDETP